MQSASPRAWSGAIDDFGRLAAYQRDGEVEHIQTGAGRLGYRAAAADFGPIRLQMNATGTDYLTRGAVRRGRWAVIFDPRLGDAARAQGESRMNGHVVSAASGDVFLFGPGAPLQSQVVRGQRWVSLVLDEAPMAAMFGDMLPGEGECRVSAGLLARAPGLAAYLRDLSSVIGSDPAMLAPEAAAGSVRETIAMRLAEALGADHPLRAALPQRRQVRLASAATDFLDAALDRPIYTESVCEALGVGPRLLNGAFQSVYGTTLHQYLKLRRLNLARQRLLAPDGSPPMVKQVALDLGLWHFGRFAVAYRALFGETPSETLARRTA